ncbi:MAG: glycosyltransferase N-terminal domain-containing protein [Hyphomonadaceae bacterium]|nr:glycosyltransferase N-terminal domain-containing protein [Hyphomonadaceae bacterium]
MTRLASLTIYRAFMRAFAPLRPLWLRRRARQDKEIPGRLGERFGRASAPRPAGLLIWLQAASVGESGVARALIAALAARTDAHFLLTTGTATAARLIAERPPPRTLHQFIPDDHPEYVARFLDHWRPDLGVFIESDLWPNLALAAQARATPLALVNARFNTGSLARWRIIPGAFRRILEAFSCVLASDAATAEGLEAITGVRPPLTGNLKTDAAATHWDEALAADLRAAIGGRKAWIAASTHPGEDEIALAAHTALRAKHPDALLIIAPRHVERGGAIALAAGGAPQRSRGAAIGAEPVHIVDTMGELIAFYAAAPAALVCGSLLPTLKGHNPIEPARAGAAVLTGPHVASFADIYAALQTAGGVRIVADAHEIAGAVDALWTDEAARKRMTASAAALFAEASSAADGVAERLIALMRRGADAAA